MGTVRDACRGQHEGGEPRRCDAAVLASVNGDETMIKALIEGGADANETLPPAARR